MSVEIVRTARGTFAPGHSGNLEGGRVTVAARAKRRLERAVARQVNRPACSQAIADKLVAGMKDPDEFPVAARLGFDRVWPVPQKHELSGPDGGPIEIVGTEARMRLAEDFGETFPDDQALVLDADDTSVPSGDQRDVGVDGET